MERSPSIPGRGHVAEHRRASLLGTTALVPAALACALAGLAPAALADCVAAGTVATCSGAIPGGYVASGGVTQLTVQGLTGHVIVPVGPALGITGRGGDGGNGGDGITDLDSAGNGGGGGAGAALTATIDLRPYRAAAGAGSTIVATSRGGDGGKGGDHYALDADGGRGGRGGDGGTVSLTLRGTVLGGTTARPAVLVASEGGNGGRGGDGKGAKGEGGNGGGAGVAGNATARIEGGRITTTADGAVGVAAVSRGGIAGDGGSGTGIVGEGGGSATGGAAGTATIWSVGEIRTSGIGAIGLFSQSIGGQGGGGGSAGSLFASQGGDGTYGGAGGAAIVTNARGGGVITTGAAAHGVMALSLGGGGGAGGSGGSLIFGLGAPGGSGGAGGLARITNDGLVETSGARAAGLIAQSIGGGGGDGGDGAGLASFGGRGAQASPGGTVEVRNSHRVTTRGNEAQGVFAQSVGGGGGRGGSALGVVAFGAAGGAGGAGGDVTVMSTGTVDTFGRNATGVFAQSIGGGGGAGGGAVSGGLVTLSFGGAGGAGGDGGAVRVNDAVVRPSAGTPGPAVRTAGEGSAGIFAQSVGGGGGNSGYAGSVAAFGSFGVSVAMGAGAGSGGQGGAVSSRFQGTVATGGGNAAGIVLQSVGGGGGNAGTSVALAQGSAFSAGIALGGSGGSGGTAGLVTFNGAAAITTLGGNSAGLVAQSIGGGGGNGGAAVAAGGSGLFSANVGLGGSGAQGGQGGAVRVTNAAAIQTGGALSHGIVAQSIGGGGGNGGMALTGGLSLGGAASFSLGGSAAAGGAAGAVTVVQAAPEPPNPNPAVTYGIRTLGDGAHGILAQSVGGGGGAGGMAGSLTAGGSFAIGATLGGAGGVGASGARVSVTLEGSLDTHGARAYGILAQSVGGGGGDGGFAVGGAGAGAAAVNLTLGGSGGTGGTAGAVTVGGTARVTTRGDGAIGVLAQSVGGGGGAGGFAAGASAVGAGGAVTVTLGGSGGTGGHGGAVVVDRAGAVTTGTLAGDGMRGGHGAIGILAQSIGGGGGSGGASGGLAGSGVGAAINVTLGGSGGSGGNGRDATIAQRSGAVTTFGDGAVGLMAQSIGGGGGNGGFALGAAGTGKGAAVAVTVGGAGAVGGSAGTARVVAQDDVTTHGDLAYGVLAQSIGGGGGNGGFAGGIGFTPTGAAMVATVGGRGGAGGAAGRAELVVNGDIATHGQLAHGVFAQSVGGGGGTGGLAVGAAVVPQGLALQATVGGAGSAAGAGGAVSVTQSGAVSTRGDGAIALVAQSVGGGGGDGGMAVGLTGGGQSSFSLGATLGGAGGSGGAGGAVSVTSSGTLSTLGMIAHGLLAQSVGGGGGTGGMALGGGVSLGTQGVVTLGGGGGLGGAGGAVAVVRGAAGQAPVARPVTTRSLASYGLAPGGTATIAATGQGSSGIVAQSIGGGGGDGGLAGSLQIGLGDQAKGVTFAVGGTGGAGGAGGAVEVRVADLIRAGSDAPAEGEEIEATLQMLRATGLSAEGGHARGILAQSIGGGGGNGGGAIAVGLNNGTGDQASLQVAVGGSGGSGGAGGAATVSFVGAIETRGAASDGILVQSIGGGGGTGGFSAAGSIAAGTGAQGRVAIGGSGGLGGSAAAAAATVQGSILTDGNEARGVVVQSIGGGGGTGGMSLALAAAPGTQGGQDLQLAIGGSGGVGGVGGDVTLTTLAARGETSVVATRGNDAHALVAQSIGGGGGIGGLAVAAYLGRASEKENTTVTAAIGGAGGVGGLGGAVRVTNVASVQTEGLNAYGILAQSIGGGGGAGGMSVSGFARIGSESKERQLAVTVSVGGAGGSGNRAGTVDVVNTGTVLTLGDGSHAIYAQSIGGGGGVGGQANAIALSLGRKPGDPPEGAPNPDKQNVNLTAIVGGAGGSGGHGARVAVTNTAAIETRGAVAHGIVAQSIGGGGGAGGNGQNGFGGLLGRPSVERALGLYPTLSRTDRTSMTRTFKVAVGGSGGASGDGGEVSVTNTGSVLTLGEHGWALFAQSVGGGGGMGGQGLAGALGKLSIGGEGVGGGLGGTVTVAHLAGAVLETRGELAHALVAQSIGGGGGAGGGAGGIVAIGRSGGGGGDGGAVTVTNAGGVLTGGVGAVGVAAQSVGGGGGIGGATGLGNDPEPGTRIIAFGAAGGSSGHGGTVRLTHAGAVRTTGDIAYGLVAQSVGGGGGFGHFVVPPGGADPATASNSLLGQYLEPIQPAIDYVKRLMARPVISFGATGTSGGDGGLVVLRSTGGIETRGAGAHAILAQSIGGGGGAGGGTGYFEFGSTGGAGGSGGTVDVALAGGTVLTTGARAFGVAAQSIGGGGGAADAPLQADALPYEPAGWVVRAGGTPGTVGNAGRVTVALTGSALVDTRGADAVGLFAQSVAGGGGLLGGDVSGQNHVTMGGAGVAGGAGAVSVTFGSATAEVGTRGARAHGVVGQSLAGGGGWAAQTPGALRLGGDSPLGNAGTVGLRLAGSITTRGQDAAGVVAQSIAGGGGIGGGAGRELALGARGGSGGNAAQVEIRTNAEIGTSGARAVAILAQSLAGGGGMAARGGATHLGVDAAGAGGQEQILAGAVGGVVVCGMPQAGAAASPCSLAPGESATGPATPGVAVATGAFGAALVAQSINGGGGLVGLASGESRLGGAALGAGGAVVVRDPGALGADGADGVAAVIQSVGGGGGMVLNAGGAVRLGGTALPPLPGTPPADLAGHVAPGGSVAVTLSGAVSAQGARGIGVVAQSVGGGGGAVVSAGGAARLGGERVGAGGTVGLASSGQVATSGPALVAQSIGGGGGFVGRATGAVTLGTPSLAEPSMGGGVTVTQGGGVTTTGQGGIGVLAQSVGGGGGVVGGGDGTITAGGGNGAGGLVQVTNSGSIGTAGAAAHGILAQSLGGGGGVVLGPVPNGTRTVLGGRGAGGEVTVANTAAIGVSGEGAHGIVAQSAGGGGAFVGGGAALPAQPGLLFGAAGGVGGAGAVRVTTSATVQAVGARGIGIWAESLGAGISGAISVEIGAEGAAIGGAGGAGVRIRGRGGPTSTIVNDGLIATLDGAAGRAVVAEGNKALGLVNRGTITGSVEAVQANVSNLVNGTFNAGPRVALGSGLLSNAGSLAVGGRGAVATTELTGRFSQGSTGRLYVDVAVTPGGIATDRLNVSGTAVLGGRVLPEFVPGSALAPGSYGSVIVSAAGGSTLSGATVQAPTPPATLNLAWTVSTPNPNDVRLGVTATAAAPGAPLSANQRAVAVGLTGAMTANPTGFAAYNANIYGATDAASYGASMTSLGGDGGLSGLLAAQGAARQFMQGMTARLDLLQRSEAGGFVAPASFAPFALSGALEGEPAAMSGEALLGMDSLADVLPSPARFWAMPIGVSGSLDARSAFGANPEARIGGFMMGFDYAVSPRLLVGAVGGYSEGSYSAGDLLARAQLRGGHAGVYAMWQEGPLYLSGTLGYARHETQQSRVIGLEGSSEYARAGGGIHTGMANVEIGWRQRLGGVVLTPFAGIGLHAWRQDESTEASFAATGGAGSLGLTQMGRSDLSVPLSLGMRFDTSFRLPNGLAMTPFLRAAWVHESSSSVTSTAAFAVAPGESFTTVTPRTARDRLSLNAGVQLQPNERIGFGIGVLGDLGDGAQSLGGYGRIVVKW